VREKDKRKSKTTNTHIHEQREIEGKNSVKKNKITIKQHIQQQQEQ